MRYLNQLEPDELIDIFLEYPPRDFHAELLDDNTPAFSAKFDLLTTLEPELFCKIKKLPFYSTWSEWLKPYTCFIGTTVSEYMLMPAEQEAKAWINRLRKEFTKNYSFLIIKDIPQASPLLDDNCNNMAKAVIESAKKSGFIIVEGQALAWTPIDFKSIDDYLNRLSKNSRKDMRRKLKLRTSLDIDILPTGDPYFLSADIIARFYQLYINVFNQSDIHFDIISQDFFTRLLQTKSNNGVVMIYRSQGDIIGYNICFIVNNKLIDKYVGFQYPQAREYNLYFISWFINLEYAINHKLSHYVAGWTDADVKKSLGAQFTFTYHAVYIRNPIVRAILKPFRPLFERDHAFTQTESAQQQELL